MPRRTRIESRAEISALRERLDEAEQTLDAIRSGHVDALVVHAPDGERVFTLQGADHRYRRLVETMDEGAAIVGLDGTVLYCNRRFATMVATPLARVTGSQVRRFVRTSWRPTFDALLGLAALETARTEIELVTATGAVVPVYLSATGSGEGEVPGVCLVVTDLTDQKRNQAIVAAERLAASILEQSTEAIVVCDPHARVIRASRGAHRLAAHNPLLRPFSMAFPLRGAALGEGGVPGAALRGEVLSGVEVTMARADGGEASLLVSAGPLVSAEGQSLGCVVSLTDITERASLRAREQAALRASEAANRMKDEFLATVSHELRTPLTAILGWSRMLRGARLPPDRRERAIETIERNAQAQAQIIEDILDVSRIISGKLRVEFRPVGLREVLLAAMDAVRPTAEAKGIELDAALDADVGRIHGDPDRLQQVVWNLLSNALKFTPKGGRVSLRLFAREGFAEIEVSDTGSGIAPEFLPHVFDRFRQADSTMSRAHGGLGLGLAIVRQLVNVHGGAVSAASDGPGSGAVFMVRLPLREEGPDPSHDRPTPAPSADAPAPDALALAGVRALVVDDEPDARALVTYMLEVGGARVTTVGSALEALELIPRLRPDVLVSDIGMPMVDGYELLRRIRALSSDGGGATRVLAVTAYARAEDRATALRAGFDGYVSKPVDLGALLAAVTSLVGRA